MGVLNGQLANQDTFNEAFLDKNTDTETSNKVTLSDPDEGATVDSVQGSINEIFDTQGTSEGDANAKVYANTNYIADGDSQKTAIEKLDAQAGTADGDLTNHVADLTAHRNFDTLANLTTWATTADDGWFGFATDTKQSFQVIDGALEPIGGGGGLNYLGTWDASTNTPSLPIGDEENGDFYVVDVAGTQDIGNGSVDWAVGDWAIYNDSTGFLKIDNSELVSSVNGQTGAVVLDADDIAETTSRYWDVKNNRTATTNPTVTNDDSENYAQGSTWLNTSTGTMYVCTDASAGAAVWKIQSGSDSKNTRWGNVNRNTVSSSDWVTTGTAAVTDNSLDGSMQDSFQVNTGTAGDTAGIEHVIPPAAIDVRHNQAVIEYMLYDISDPVVCTVLDWDDNIIGQVELPQTGSGTATADNFRFAHATVDFSFLFSHGSLIRSVKFRFECASDINAGQFLVNFIQSDSNPRSIGQYIEDNNVVCRDVVGGSVSSGSPIPFVLESGNGWSGTQYTSQKSGSTIRLKAGFNLSSSSANVNLYKNGSLFKELVNTVPNTASTHKNVVVDILPSEHVKGDLFDIRPSSGITVNATNPDENILNITETVNRRSISKSVDTFSITKYLAASTTAAGDISDLTVAGLKVGASYLCLPNIYSVDIQDLYFRSEASGSGDVYNRHYNNSASTQTQMVGSPFIFTATSTEMYVNKVGTASLTGNNTTTGTWLQIIELPTSQSVEIPVDEIIADGNEYPVFGKFITVGGVKYQVFRRAIQGTYANGDAVFSSLPSTLIPLTFTGNLTISANDIRPIPYSNSDYPKYVASSNEVEIVSGGTYDYTIVFDYYDTARPYYG